MKQIGRFSFFSMMAAGLVTAALVSAHGNEERVATATIGGGKVTVEYAAPSLKGRDVMSLISPGSYWRMGADKLTTMTTDIDLMFGDTKVPKGTYTLLAHFLEGGKWSLVVAEGASRSGPEGMVAEVPGTMESIDEPVEHLTIHLKVDGPTGKLLLEWGTHRFIADFSVA